MFYRLYEFLTYLPFDKKLEDKYNIAKYQRFVPFSPHTIEETISFEDRFKKILSKKFEKYNKKNSNSLEDNKIITPAK